MRRGGDGAGYDYGCDFLTSTLTPLSFRALSCCSVAVAVAVAVCGCVCCDCGDCRGWSSDSAEVDFRCGIVRVAWGGVIVE